MMGKALEKVPDEDVQRGGGEEEKRDKKERQGCKASCNVRDRGAS